jgi:hypothetical protein
LVGSRDARSVLLTVLGEYVLPLDDGVWQETLVRSLEALGHKTQSARQALARSATVTSTAADAALAVSDPRRLRSRPARQRHVRPSRAAGCLCGGWAEGPCHQAGASVRTLPGPASNRIASLAFTQTIAASEALRTGSYSKTLTFTLSTTSP